MKFIPQRLKNIFTRKSKKKQASPVPAAMEAAKAPTAAPVAEKPPVVISAPPKPFFKPEALNRYKQAEGYYRLSMDINFVSELKEAPHQGRKLMMVNSPEIHLYLALVNPAPLAGVKTLAQTIRETVKKNFGIEEAAVYFRDLQNGAHIDAADDFTGLPPTRGQYQIILIPKDCAWRPIASAPRRTPPGTSPLLRPPGQ